MVLFVGFSVQAQNGGETYVRGELAEDTTWTGTVVLEETVTVPVGIVLNVKPGTIVSMMDSVSLIVYGQLIADGNEAESIRFTRHADNITWKQIMFIEAEDSRFTHCIFEYADCEGQHQDYYEPGPRNYHEAIVALATHLDFEGCTFQNLPDGGNTAEGDTMAIISDDPNRPGQASANIRNCRFLSIGQGVHTRFSYVLVEDCFFTGKRGDNDDVDLWGESVPPPLIRNNLFLNPEHDDMINPTRCSAVIIGNVIIGSDDHGVVLRDRGFPVVMNNLIIDCSTAGIAIENSCEALLVNNTIVDCGRGLRLFDLGRWGPPYRLNPGGGTATVVNCIIWDCPQPVTLADSSNTEIEDTGSHITISYSVIPGGQDGVIISGTNSTVTWGQGNIDIDPQFTDPANGDYHLKSQAERFDPDTQSWVIDDVASPCIDAGDPNSPVAFEPNPNGGIINMGAYGGTAEASKSPSGIHAKYGGGTGEPNDPYLIYTVDHLNTLGDDTSNYNKHFKLMADIDLSGYFYDRAVIAPDMNDSGLQHEGIPFTGILDGNGHKISNLTIKGHSYLGLFGYLDGDAIVSNLSIETVDVNGISDFVSGIAGFNYGSIIGCNCTGEVSGNDDVGGLVGSNSIGGDITNCYSTVTVNGNEKVGGLVGYTKGGVTMCYSTGTVIGVGQNIGGLVGERHLSYGIVTNCFWDTQTSGQTSSAGGTGKTTAEMQTESTFTDAGWDFVGETANGTEDIWWIDEGKDYPRLWWEPVEE